MPEPYDSLHVDISTPGTLVLPAPPAAVPTKAELMRELADALEVLEGLDGARTSTPSTTPRPRLTPWKPGSLHYELRLPTRDDSVA